MFIPQRKLPDSIRDALATRRFWVPRKAYSRSRERHTVLRSKRVRDDVFVSFGQQHRFGAIPTRLALNATLSLVLFNIYIAPDE